MNALCHMLSRVQVVDSRVSTLAAAGASAASSTADLLLPQHLREALAQASSSVLPAGLKAGRVPITIQMRLGKNDAGGCCFWLPMPCC